MNFNTEYSILYIVFSFLVAGLISFFYYRKTNISYGYKFLLIGLRAIIITSFLLLLFVSYFVFTKNKTEKPLNVFLFDVSKSISLENRYVELGKSLDLVKAIGNSNSENKYFLFSEDIIKEINPSDISSIKIEDYKNEQTNLSKSLHTLSEIFPEKKISSVNIVSDGVITKGENPAYSFPLTETVFNYILIGDTIRKNDLSIKNVFFNPTSFVQSNSQILLEFSSYNFNKEVNVKLFEEDVLIQEKKIAVNSKNTVYNCTFDLKSNTEGIKKYKLEIQNEAGEITFENNSEEFFVEFINNKFKVLIISGNPSPDLSYLSETVKSIDNFVSKIYTLKSSTEFYEGQLPPLSGMDLLVLMNFPNSSTDINLVNKISDEIKNIGSPVFFIAGSNTDYEKLKLFYNYIPFSSVTKTGNDEKSSVKLVDGLPNDIKGSFGISSTINSLPEIYLPGISLSLVPDSKTILYSSKASKPVLVVTQNSEKNSAALLGYNFYKWKLNSFNNTQNFLVNVLLGVSLSISNKEKNKNIYMNLEKQVFSPAESFLVSIFLNHSESIENNTVKLQVFNNSFTKEFVVNKISGKNFSSEVKNLPEGEYNIKCTLFNNGIEIASDMKKILVKKLNTEFKETKADKNILDNLSVKSNGSRITGENLDEVNNKIKLKNENDLYHYKQIDKVFLNSSLLLLLLIILLLSTEWFIRKRLNLP